MVRRRFELTGFERSIIKPLLPDKPRGRAARRWPSGAERHLLASRDRVAMGRPPLTAMAPLPPATTVLHDGRSSASATGYSNQFQRLAKDPGNPWTVRPSASTGTGQTQ